MKRVLNFMRNPKLAHILMTTRMLPLKMLYIMIRMIYKIKTILVSYCVSSVSSLHYGKAVKGNWLTLWAMS